MTLFAAPEQCAYKSVVSILDSPSLIIVLEALDFV